MAKSIHRSAVTGKIVSKKFAADNPATTVKERMGSKKTPANKLKVTNTGALSLISAERLRQINQEGFTAAHDQVHDKGELEDYAKFLLTGMKEYFPEGWEAQWYHKRFKRSHKENLIKAAALLAAEIDRLVSIELKNQTEPSNDNS